MQVYGDLNFRKPYYKIKTVPMGTVFYFTDTFDKLYYTLDWRLIMATTSKTTTRKTRTSTKNTTTDTTTTGATAADTTTTTATTTNDETTTQIAELQNEITTLREQLTALQTQVTTLAATANTATNDPGAAALQSKVVRALRGAGIREWILREAGLR